MTLYNETYIENINEMIRTYGTIHILQKENIKDVITICENIHESYFVYVENAYDEMWEMIGVKNIEGNLCSFIMLNKIPDNDKFTVNIQLICSSRGNSMYSQIAMLCTLFCIKQNDEFSPMCILEVSRYYYNARAFCFYSKMGFVVDYKLIEDPYNLILLPMKVDLTKIDNAILLQGLNTPNYRLAEKTQFCTSTLNDSQILIENEIYFFTICSLPSEKKAKVIRRFFFNMLRLNYLSILQDIVTKIEAHTSIKLKRRLNNLKPYLGANKQYEFEIMYSMIYKIVALIIQVPKEKWDEILATLPSTDVATAGGNKRRCSKRKTKYFSYHKKTKRRQKTRRHK